MIFHTWDLLISRVSCLSLSFSDLTFFSLLIPSTWITSHIYGLQLGKKSSDFSAVQIISPFKTYKKMKIQQKRILFLLFTFSESHEKFYSSYFSCIGLAVGLGMASEPRGQEVGGPCTHCTPGNPKLPYKLPLGGKESWPHLVPK